MIRIVVAMEREAKMLAERLPTMLIDVTGIGQVGLIPPTTENDVIVNVGYAGGYHVPVGRLIEPSFALDYGTGEGTSVDHIFVGCGRYRCYTANEFVTEPCTSLSSIYDMELAKLAKLPHKKLYALKIVSDSLNEQECEAFNGEERWDEVARLLKQYVIGEDILNG